MTPLDYLLDLCNPSSGFEDSKPTWIENLLEIGDTQIHLARLTSVDPTNLDDRTAAWVTEILEFYLFLIPDMLLRDDEDGAAYSLKLLENIASITDALTRQHAAIEAEMARRQLAADKGDQFWQTLFQFQPYDPYWEWPDV